ncbi:MAG: hypothetical protein EBX41_02940 [Chitinophagia bacterium]|nr:hypothetical protein [Chitinophagia bacterium]
MKFKLLLLIGILFGFNELKAQNRLGVELGAGVPAFSNGAISESQLPTESTDVVFASNIHYLRKLAGTKNWYWGGRAGFEQYAFDFKVTQADGVGGIYGKEVNHKSSYLLIGPTIDLGIGKYRQYLHVYSNVSIGFLLNATQNTREYHLLNNPIPVSDLTRSTDFYMNSVICRWAFGLKQHLPLGKMWQFTFNEYYSFMPFGDLSRATFTNGNNLHPGYFSIQAGVMHKFRDAKRVQDN